MTGKDLDGHGGNSSVHARRRGTVSTVAHLVGWGWGWEGQSGTKQHLPTGARGCGGSLSRSLQHLGRVREKLGARNRGQTGNRSGSSVEQMGSMWQTKVHLRLHRDTGQHNVLQSNPRAVAWVVGLSD